MTKPTTAQQLEEKIEGILFDCIVAIGTREEGTVTDLDTLIIDRQKAVDQLQALVDRHVQAAEKAARIDELRGFEGETAMHEKRLNLYDLHTLTLQQLVVEKVATPEQIHKYNDIVTERRAMLVIRHIIHGRIKELQAQPLTDKDSV